MKLTIPAFLKSGPQGITDTNDCRVLLKYLGFKALTFQVCGTLSHYLKLALAKLLLKSFNQDDLPL